ncbi:MAG: cytochrome oxidase putative small subunit CydP [Pseudomonadota bacterium]
MKTPLPDFLHHRLAREIALAIAIKLTVIAGIFYAFFDGRALNPDADSVADRIANPQQQSQPTAPRSAHAD